MRALAYDPLDRENRYLVQSLQEEKSFAWTPRFEYFTDNHFRRNWFFHQQIDTQRTGDTRWTYEAGNSISGGSTIIGGIVYFATLQNTATTGLDIRSGRKVYSFFDGKFDPVISDGKRLYLDGYRDLYALDPPGVAPPARPRTSTAKRPAG